MKLVPWETLPGSREWEFASHKLPWHWDQKVSCRHSERKAGMEVFKFQFSVWCIWPWRKSWGLSIEETVQVFAFLTQVLPHHHYPPSKNICINTGLTSDHFLQGTVMKIISEHSYPISQMLQTSWKKTWKCFSAAYLYRGYKMWNWLGKLLEFWKWAKRISCALTSSSSQLLLYFSTDPGSNACLCSSPKEP